MAFYAFIWCIYDSTIEFSNILKRVYMGKYDIMIIIGGLYDTICEDIRVWE